MVTDNQAKNYQIAIAIATLILTPFFSGFVVRCQLSEGQKYWNEQKILERNEEYLDRKLKLLESINSSVLDIELSSKKIKLDNWALVSKIAFAAEENKSADVGTDLEKFNDLLLQYHKDLLKFSVLIQSAAIFFSPQTSESLNKLSAAIEKNFGTGPNYQKELENFLTSEKKKDAAMFVAKIENKSSFDTSDELKKDRLDAIKLMINDIKIAHNIYMQR